jgi:PAS domain S-box-containing protein
LQSITGGTGGTKAVKTGQKPNDVSTIWHWIAHVYTIPLIFLAFSIVWITTTDWLVTVITKDPNQRMMLSMYKGWFYMLFSASLLAVLLAIAERKRARISNVLQASEARLRALLRNYPNGIVLVFDQDLRYVVADGTGLAPIGLSGERLVGKSIWQVFEQEVAERTEGPYQEALAGGTTSFEISLSKRIFSVNVAPMYSENGEIIYGIAVAEDITAKKKLETELNRSQQQLQVIVDAIDGYLWSVAVDSAGKMTALVATSGIERIYQRPLAELQTTPDAWRNYIHPKDMLGVEDCCRRVLAGEHMVHDYSIDRPDGTQRNVRNSVMPVKNEVGRVIAMTGACIDITTVRHTESALRRTMDALEESERMLRTLMGNLPGMAYRCLNEKQWTMEFVSEGCFELTGYHPAELLHNAKLSYADIIHPEDVQLVEDCVNEGLSKRGQFRIRYRILTAGGKLKHVFEQGVGITEPNGTIQHLEGFITDVTELEIARSGLQKLSDQLALQVGELERFIYTVSHDLKSPLIAIHGFASMIRKSISEGDIERSVECATVVESNAIKMERMINDLLELARAGSVAQKPVDIDLGELAAECVLSLGPDTAGITISISPELTGTSVRYDRQRLSQVFTNLLDNAVKFTRGVQEPVITVTRIMKAGEIEVVIADNGGGIAQEFRDKVFDVFTRLPSTVDPPGTGIGLAVVKRIIEANNGRVWIEGDADKGTEMHFTIPQKG